MKRKTFKNTRHSVGHREGRDHGTMLKLAIVFLLLALLLVAALSRGDRTVAVACAGPWARFLETVAIVTTCTDEGARMIRLLASLWLVPLAILAVWRVFVTTRVVAVEIETRVLSKREFWKDFLAIGVHREEDRARSLDLEEFGPFVHLRYYAGRLHDLVSVLCASFRTAVLRLLPSYYEEEAD